MRKAFEVRCERLSQPTVVRVKLTAYKPARPVTLERFRGVPAMALVREYEEMFNALHM